jgi:hypothetical protein
MLFVTLDGRCSAPLRLGIAPLCGSDEALFEPSSGPDAAIMLLRRLGRDADGGWLDVDGLDVSQADRLLAAVYTATYDDRAECRLSCAACREGYEFTLALSELIATQDAQRPGPADGEGCWTLADGRRVRAPTIGDVANSVGARDLIARLVVKGDPEADAEAVSGWLERAAPVLTIDFDAACPHCGHSASVRFDLATYLAARLAVERPFLVRETHLIAARYGWSRREIMALSRDERRAYAGLIETERAAGVRLARRTA